jgi:hypothetical protein
MGLVFVLESTRICTNKVIQFIITVETVSVRKSIERENKEISK